MKNNWDKIFLRFYVWFQYIAVVLNLLIFLIISLLAFASYGLGGDRLNPAVDTWFWAFWKPKIYLSLLYFLVTVSSLMATKKLIKEKPINIIEIVSFLIVLIGTIPLYLYLYNRYIVIYVLN